MFTLSKAITDITYESNAHVELGNRLKDFGGRILLICSTNLKDKESIIKFKKILTKNNFTFIQCDQKTEFVNKDDLEELQLRAENFNVRTVVALGGLSQRMSGRYISEKLSLLYFELPTELHNSYLLNPSSIYSNRVKNNYDKVFLTQDRITGIDIDTGFIRPSDELQLKLTTLGILLDLSQLFLNSDNNIIAKTESRNLFNRILKDLENEDLNHESILRYSLTASLYHNASTELDLELTIYTWLTGSRFNCNPYIIAAKLLPWFLDDKKEDELSGRVRDLMVKLKISCRLTDLGFTLKQLSEINNNNLDTIRLVEKAF